MAGAASPSGRGLNPMLVTVGLIVALVAVAAIAVAVVLPPPESVDEPPPAAAPAAGGWSASPSAGPGGIVVGGLVEAAADGLPVMESAGLVGARVGVLPAGQPALVADGPLERDGLTWYLLSGLGLPPNTGCEEPDTIADCPAWIGWVPAHDGAASLEPVPPECPDLSDYVAFARQAPLMQLVCTGDRKVTLSAWWAGRSPFEVCIDSPPAVDWLYCARALGGWLAPTPDAVGITSLGVAVDPASGVVLPEPGRWVQVTGHLNDPAAAACNVVPGAPGAELAAWMQVLQCRSTLVVELMVEVTGD